MNNTEIKKNLFHPKISNHYLLGNIKAESDYHSFRKKVKAIKQHPFGVNALSSNPLPKEYSDLRKNSIIPHSGNLDSEIAWLMDSILENSEKINEYIIQRQRFEVAFILGQYNRCAEILIQIETQICVSNWGIENRILLEEEMNGTEANWLFLGDITKTLNDPLSLFLAEQSSKKNESKFSYFRYKENFENFIRGTEGDFYEYLCFKILYTGYTGYGGHSFFLNVESVSSIIDRYNILIDVLIEILPSDSSHLSKVVSEELKSVIPSDQRLDQILNFFSIDLPVLQFDSKVRDLMDDYSKGNYELCISSATSLILENPLIIEVYVVYIKSLIELKRSFAGDLFSNNTSKILEDFYNIFSANDRFKASTENLLKLALRYHSFSFGKQLLGVVSEYAKLKDENKVHQFYYVVNSSYGNPKALFLAEYVSKTSSENICNSYLKCQTLSTKINIAIHKGDYEWLNNAEDISSKRKILYVARALFNSNSIPQLIELIENEKDLEQYSIITQKELIELLFEGYLQSGQTRKGLQLFVDTFFNGINMVNRLNDQHLLELLKKSSQASDLIELPIFFYISNPDIYEQYVKYDEYLESLNIERPTQLLDKDISKEKLIFFLKEICNVDIMHHSLYFDGTDDIENERIEILKHLLLIDNENEDEYIKEVTEITQKTKIRKAIREVNKGRITINTQQLKHKEEIGIKDDFARFRELVEFSSKHKIQSIDSTSKLLNDYFGSLEDAKVRDKFVSLNDPAFISFKNLFVDLRDKFLLSKDFGLDGYLSTRIRHGTFLNHIRSVFEHHHLIFQRSEGEYVQNDFWMEKLPNSLHSKKPLIQNAIVRFSSKIDQLTETIITELIQVKTEKYNEKELALFDFSITDSSLAFLFQSSRSSINSHTQFLNFVFEYLEGNVKIKLSDIRDIFRNQIKDRYIDIINTFDKEIRGIIENDFFVDLTSSVSMCQTDILNELESIAEWFNISNPSSDLVLDVKTIIHTALEITNTISPNQNINPFIEDKTELTFANGVNDLLYIIRILLDNIIKHSGLPVSEREASIISDFESENILRISVSNKIDKKIKEKVSTELAKIKNKWNDRNDFTKINIEGGSGFDKIRRILAVDMQNKNYDFEYKIDGDRLTISIKLEVKFVSISK